jgi:hypothetical protein
MRYIAYIEQAVARLVVVVVVSAGDLRQADGSARTGVADGDMAGGGRWMTIDTMTVARGIEGGRKVRRGVAKWAMS